MYLTRHRDLLGDIKLDTPISIIGAGSIGSYATLSLAKLGFTNIVVADDGKVEEENIAPQFYGLGDIGKFKVDCLKRSISRLTGTDIIALPTRIEEGRYNLVNINQAHERILVLAVDSMSARKDLFVNMYFRGLVDARMAIEFLTVISYGSSEKYPENYSKYSATLFSDDQAVQEACTNKAISYTSLIAGGIVAKRVLDILKGDDAFTTINFDINSFDMVRL